MNTWKLSLIQSPSNNFYQLIRSTPSWYAQLIGASDWNGKGNLRCLLEYLSASQQRGTTLRQASSSLCRSFLTTGCPVPQSSPSIQDILPSICRGHILTPPPVGSLHVWYYWTLCFSYMYCNGLYRRWTWQIYKYPRDKPLSLTVREFLDRVKVSVRGTILSRTPCLPMH